MVIQRRSFLAGVAALTVSAAKLLCSPVLAAVSVLTRVRPGGAGWPTAREWADLSSALSGKLLRPGALFAECGGNQASEQSCRAVMENLRNPFFIGDQPSGTQVSGWFNAWTPAPSAYAVAANSARDVAIAVNFARTHNLRVVVKGGGHSYLGTSNAPDSLLIWTRSMRAIRLEDRFVPRGCSLPPVTAVSIDAGAMWIDAYDAVTTKAGRYVQGGGCATVGVAGLIQSGGFGSFSKFFGMASANLLEAEIVTADGRIRVVNECNDPELFWALKGGGGGSFGVITNLTLRTHELPAFFGGTSAKIKAKDDASFKSLISRFLKFYSTNLFNPHWGESVTLNSDNSLEINMVSAGLNADECTAAFKPFFDFVAASQELAFTDGPDMGAGAARGWWDVEARRRRGSNAMISDSRPEAPAAHAYWSGDQDQVGAFLYGYESLWLPSTLLDARNAPRLENALFAASRYVSIELHFNKGLAGASEQVSADARHVATNPAVIDAFALAIFATGGASQYPGQPGARVDKTAAQAGAQKVDAAALELRKLIPNAGSYLSESNYFLGNWQQEYWGANYPRLRAAKRRYDPEGLFFVHHGVGSEEWSADGFTRVP